MYPKKFILFYKFQADFTVRLKVIINEDMNVTALKEEEKLDYLQFNVPKSIQDIDDILSIMEQIDK